jgi:hypothetical protein
MYTPQMIRFKRDVNCSTLFFWGKRDCHLDPCCSLIWSMFRLIEYGSSCLFDENSSGLHQVCCEILVLGDQLLELKYWVFWLICLSFLVHSHYYYSTNWYEFNVGPETLVLDFWGLYQFLRYFFGTFRHPFFDSVSPLTFPISCTPVSSSSCWYGCLWRGDNPAECTGTLQSVGLGIIAPEPIEIS